MRNSAYLAALLAGSALAAASGPGEARAQGAAQGGAALQEIVVTARRREENLQRTPVAITAVTSDTLEKRNVVTLAQISRIAPSLQIYQTVGGIGSAGMFMRGIGYADNVPGQDNPIGVYVDGVYSGRLGAGMMDLVEPDQVEVLRGPQGTLFGRNTTGGAILITTHTPRDEFNGNVKASYGSYNARQVQLRVDTGLLAASGIKTAFAYQHRSRDGTFDVPSRPSNQDPGAERSDAYWFKGAGGWGDFSATLTADYNELKGYAQPLQIIAATPAVVNFINLSTSLGGSPYIVTTTPQRDLYDATRGEQRVWSEGLGLTLLYRFNDYLSVKSITGLRAFERNDPSGYGPAVLIGNIGTVAAPRLSTFDGLYSLQARGQGVRARSEELQFLGNAGDFDYVGGLYYYSEDAWDNGRTRLPFVLGTGATALEVIQHRIVNVESKSQAAFLQGDYKPGFLDQKLELSAGIRYTKDKRDFDERGTIVHLANIRNDNTSYLVSAKYQWTNHAMTYIRYSTGYRAGGINSRAPTTADPVFLPERLKSLEGGFKIDFLDNRVRLNGAAFHNKYRDLQTGGFSPPSATSAGGNNVVNANAKYDGYELELQAAPIDGLTLTASIGHVDPEYETYPTALTAGAVDPGCTAIRSGAGALIAQDCAKTAKFLYFPKTSLDASVSYTAPPTSYGVWSAFMSYSYKSSIQFSTFLTATTPFQTILKQDPYGILTARIQLGEIPISGAVRGQIALFGDNLTDTVYDTQGIDFQTFATAGYSVGRTVGIEGRIEF